ncbi:MAG: MFS transporter [Candidatus Beckwithbacteria bacterium]|nr:MFS transporter [Patescibacteria group bacterium]
MSLHKNIRLLAWFNFFLDLRLYAPVAIIYFSRVTGSYALGMSVFSMVMLTSAIFEVPTGVFSDRIGRKKTVILGAGASLFSVILYALGGSYLILLAGAMLEGLARSFYSGNNDSLLHDTLLESKQTKQYAEYKGKTDSVAQVALGIAALVGAVVAHWSFFWVMWLSVLPAMAGLWVSVGLVEPKVHEKKSGNIYAHLKKAINGFLSNKKLRKLSLASIIGYAGGESGYQFSSAFIQTLWPIWAIGVSKALTNIGAAISFYFSGKLIKKYGEYKLWVVGKIYSLVTSTVALIFPTVASPLIMATSSVFFGTSTVASSTLKQFEYTQEQRSTMDSLNSLFGSIAFAIVSFCLGLVADLLTPAKALLSLQVLAVISLSILWGLFRKGGEKC